MANVNMNLIYDVLNDIGAPQHLKGYKCLAESVRYLSTHIESRPSITKDVYPYVVGVMGSTASRVERAIRHIIEYIFLNTDPDVITKYFGNSVNVNKGKVTNSQFLYTISNYVLMHQEGD